MLSADADVTIRGAAAAGLNRLPVEDPRVLGAVKVGIAGPGCHVALAVAMRLASPSMASTPLTKQLADRLSRHESARVRKFALHALARISAPSK